MLTVGLGFLASWQALGADGASLRIPGADAPGSGGGLVIPGAGAEAATGAGGLVKKEDVPRGNAAPVLRETVQAEDPVTRLSGLEGLAPAAGEHVEEFLDALGDESEEIQRYAAHVLNGLEVSLFFEQVLGRLASGDADTAWHMGMALGLLGDSLEVRFCGLLLSPNETFERRYLAVHALALIGGADSVDVLAQCAHTADVKLAVQCASALGTIPDVIVVPHLVRLAGHSAPEVRYAALHALGGVPGPEAAAGLAEVASGARADDPGIGVQAISLLSERGADMALPLLVEVLRLNAEVGREVVNALRRLSGEDFGDSAEAWGRWWQEEQMRRMQPPMESESAPWDVMN